MLFSYNWLQSFLNKKLPNPKKLAELLTMSVVEIEGVEKKGDDFIFEVDNKSITNRPDLWGHAGLAREAGAVINSKLKVHPPKSLSGIVAGRKNNLLQVDVKEKKLCSRYLGLVIDNIKVGPSPKWIREKIEGCGLDSINNVVDITNYIMLELGQPMHAFDFEKIANINPKSQIKKIIVRKTKQEEKIVSLSGDEYDLDKNVLVIADNNEAIAIAGIKGGKKSEINSETKTIILEAANFEPINIRKSARALDLRTDAAMRFEKGLDPNLAETAMARAIDLIKEIIPDARIASSLADEKNFKEKTVKIKLPFEYVNKKIGLEIKKTEIISILKSLDFEINPASFDKTFSSGKRCGTKDYLTVKIPSWRAKDISIKDDLVEEIARVFGYGNIIQQMPKVKLSPAVLNSERKFEQEAKNILINNFGFSEVCNYSFVGENLLEKLNINYNNHICLANSISRDQTMMRQSLIPNLISNTKNNLRYFENFRIFEIGRIFTKEKSDNKISRKENKFLPKQEKFISGIFIEKNNSQPFYKAKHCVEDLFKQLNLGILNFQIPDEKEILPWVHPSRSLNILKNKKRVGIITELNPQIAENFGIKQRVGIFEICLDELFKISEKEKKYQPICKFPSVILDLSIIIDRKILWQEIQDLVFKTGGTLIKNIEPFDVYEGKNIPAGKKSLAFHITYQAKDRTLKDEEVKNLQDKIIDGLEEKLGAEIRKLGN